MFKSIAAFLLFVILAPLPVGLSQENSSATESAAVSDEPTDLEAATITEPPLAEKTLPPKTLPPKTLIPKTLIVGTREVPPFAMLNEDNQWEGISIDLLRDVKAELENISGREIEIQFKTQTLQEMLDAVANSSVDVAAAALTVNYERETKMDFTHSFHTSGLGIAVGARQRRSGWSGIIDAVFSETFGSIVAGLLIAMLISAVAVYLFERNANPEHFDHGWFRGVAAGMWWAAVTLTTVGYGDKVPKTFGGRTIALVWMFAGLFIIAGFTAAVTSALTLTELRAKVSGPADLSRVKVATVEASTSADYLRSRNIMFASHSDVASALASLAANECDAVVYDAPVLRYQAFQNYAGEVFILQNTFERQNYAFALPSNSPLREPINRVLLRKISSPSWDEVLRTYFGETRQ